MSAHDRSRGTDTVRSLALDVRSGSRRALAVVEEVLRLVLGDGRARALTPTRPFMEMGLDSMEMLEVKSLLGERFGRELGTEFLFRYSTMENVALALATPLLSLIGAVCVALTVGMRRSGMLLALLVLPLYVPVLIFGAGACNAAQAGLAFMAPLLWLGAGLVLTLVLAPLACAAALKISLS